MSELQERPEWTSINFAAHLNEPPHVHAASHQRHVYASQKRKSKRKQFSTNTLPNRLNKFRCSFNSKHSADIIRYPQPFRSTEDMLNNHGNCIREFNAMKNTFRNIHFIPDMHSTPNRQDPPVDMTMRSSLGDTVDNTDNLYNGSSLSAYFSDRGEIGLGNFSSIYRKSSQDNVKTVNSISKIIDSQNNVHLGDDLPQHAYECSKSNTALGSRSNVMKRRGMNGVSWIFSLALTDDPKGRAYRNQLVCSLITLAACIIICALLIHFFGGFSLFKNVTFTALARNFTSSENAKYNNGVRNETTTPKNPSGGESNASLSDASKLSQKENMTLLIAKLRLNLQILMKSDNPKPNIAVAQNFSTINYISDADEKIAANKTVPTTGYDDLHFCKECKKDVEVCLTDEEIGIPRCLAAVDPDDPTGCGGLCALEVESCHVLDRRRGVRTCRATPRAGALCARGEWRCANQLCIPAHQRCDGHLDCYDYSDEVACQCDRLTSFHCGNFTSCLNKAKKCNGIVDCWDGSDEMNCTKECPDSQFTCTHGGCIHRWRFCDGLPDCDDASDEPIGCGGNCRSHEIRCGNRRCIPRWRRCNGVDDCGDLTDEVNCKIFKSNIS